MNDNDWKLELELVEDAGAVATAEPSRLSFSVASRNAFFKRIGEQLARRLPSELAGFTARPYFNIMKVSYANERVHYEVAFDIHRRTMEIALHFEDGPISTLAYLSYFDQRILELKHTLGHQIELERWTVSWGRIYEIWPFDDLDTTTAERVAVRLAEYIAILQPLVEACGIAPERSAQPAGPPRDRWRRKGSAG